MIEMETFRYDDSPIRTVVIDGEPWFIARDVAVVLGYRDAHNAVRLLDDDEKGTHLVSTPGGEQSATVISEPGLYVLTMRSDMPDAKRFRKWVTHKVLPTIRRTGSYEAPRAIPQTFAEALRLAADEHERAQAALAKVVQLTPRAAQADHFRQSEGLAAIADFANDLALWAREQLGIRRVLHADVRDFLGEIGLLIRGNTIRNNQPTADAIKRDLMRPHHSTYPTHTHGKQSATSARFTPKGWGYAWDRATKRLADHGSLTSAA